MCPFKTFQRFLIKSIQCICSPELFFGFQIQNLISKNIKLKENQWIYNVEKASTEYVLKTCQDFLICYGKKDGKMCTKKLLIVYSDRNLHTLRDLRAKHIGMLQKSYQDAIKTFKDLHPKEDCIVYFNYFPSTYQLHAHVTPCQKKIFIRSHNLLRVVKNLHRDSSYYCNALILTRICLKNPLATFYQPTKSSNELETEILSQTSLSEVNLVMSKLTLAPAT